MIKNYNGKERKLVSCKNLPMHLGSDEDRLPWFFVCLRCSSQSLQAWCPLQRYEKT